MIRFLIFTAALCGTVVLTDWTAVKTEAKIPWDLETTPLQIKTESTLGSKEEMFVKIYDKDMSYVCEVVVYFSTIMRYKLVPCTGDINTWTDLPVQPPVEVEKIWTFTKTETAFTITCNGVEVLTYQFADSPHGDCVTKLGGDVVEQIQFLNWDTASDYYWTVCPNITITNSPTDLNGIEAGNMVTITCTDHYLLKGAAALTCQLDGTWPIIGLPQCDELGSLNRSGFFSPTDITWDTLWTGCGQVEDTYEDTLIGVQSLLNVSTMCPQRVHNLSTICPQTVLDAPSMCPQTFR
uniref:Putative secretory peptide-1 n=1 Tax=Pleurobrachia bachei TaxID=34499 RepID=M4H255_PLEBA|nr:putative secretory peptide-1 [Pleurobrachia bachei]